MKDQLTQTVGVVWVWEHKNILITSCFPPVSIFNSHKPCGMRFLYHLKWDMCHKTGLSEGSCNAVFLCYSIWYCYKAFQKWERNFHQPSLHQAKVNQGGPSAGERAHSTQTRNLLKVPQSKIPLYSRREKEPKLPRCLIFILHSHQPLLLTSQRWLITCDWWIRTLHKTLINRFANTDDCYLQQHFKNINWSRFLKLSSLSLTWLPPISFPSSCLLAGKLFPLPAVKNLYSALPTPYLLPHLLFSSFHP